MTQSGFLLHPCLVLVLVHPCLVPTPGKKSVCQCNEDVGCVVLCCISCAELCHVGLAVGLVDNGWTWIQIEEMDKVDEMDEKLRLVIKRLLAIKRYQVIKCYLVINYLAIKFYLVMKVIKSHKTLSSDKNLARHKEVKFVNGVIASDVSPVVMF